MGQLGLSCSYELVKRGISPVVYEKEEFLGGLLAYGIPDFRLDKKIVDRIIKTLKDLGVEFKTGFELGRNLHLKDLQKEYDDIFVGIGAEISSIYKLSEENLDGIYNSDEFLRSYNLGQPLKNLGKVVVIGGGNVAMDSARAAIRMGVTKVSILYRRDRNYMPARKAELKDCLKDGVEFKELVRVAKASGENGRVKNVHCINTKIVDGKAVDTTNEFDYDADTVVFAIGLKPNKELLESEGLELETWGTIKVDENNRTNLKNIYAGGDVAENKSVVCKALASGKKVALEMINKKA